MVIDGLFLDMCIGIRGIHQIWWKQNSFSSFKSRFISQCPKSLVTSPNQAKWKAMSIKALKTAQPFSLSAPQVAISTIAHAHICTRKSSIRQSIVCAQQYLHHHISREQNPQLSKVAAMKVEYPLACCSEGQWVKSFSRV